MANIERSYDIGAVIVAHRAAAHDRRAQWTKLSDMEYDAIAGTVLRTATNRRAVAEVERLRAGMRNALRDLDPPPDVVRMANARATLAKVLEGAS